MMPKFSQKPGFLIIAILTLSLGVGACGKLSSEDVAKTALEVTVMVDGCAAGSGMIYRREGNTYSVLTAHHVVKDAQITCLIITPDGFRHNANPQVTVPVPDVDLAVMTFTSDKDYKLAKWGDSDKVAAGQTVYVAGAPEPTEAIPNRTIIAPDGKIIGKISQPNQGYSLIYNNSTQPGMSGGPVLDDQGKVIGVHGRGDRDDTGRKTGQNLAIPIATFLDAPKSAIAQGGQIVQSPSSDRLGGLDLADGLVNYKVIVTNSVRSITFSPDGQTLASGGMDGVVRLWDVATGQELRQFIGHTNYVYSIAFSSDGKTMASGSGGGTVRLWDVATGQELRQLQGHTSGVSSVSFSPDGKTLASGSGGGTVRLWDMATGQELRQLTGHTSWVLSVSFSPDGKTLASGSGGGTVRLWDVATGRELRLLRGHTSSVSSVSFSPDGKTLASGSEDNTVRLWDVATGRELRQLTGHKDWVRSVSFSPDGKYLASGSDDNTVRLWDVATGRELRQLTGHTSWVRSVSFSPDGQTLASGSVDGVVRLWRVR